MRSLTMLRAAARWLSQRTDLSYKQALDHLARESCGFRGYESAKTRLPEFERSLAGNSITVSPDDEGFLLTSKEYRIRLPFVAAADTVLGHCAWLLGLNSYWAASYALTDEGKAIVGDVIDEGTPAVIDHDTFNRHRHYVTLAGFEARKKSAESPELHESLKRRVIAADLGTAPLRADVLCWRGHDGRPLSNLPIYSTRHHSPKGIDWGYAGSGPANFALNLANAVVPPLHDGHSIVILPQSGSFVSQSAWSAHQPIKEQLIAQLPEEGGTIARKDIGRIIEETMEERESDGDLHSIRWRGKDKATGKDIAAVQPMMPVRCADDLTYFRFSRALLETVTPMDA